MRSLGFLEWNSRPLHNLATTIPFLSHHFCHTTSLQERAQGFLKLHSILLFGHLLMLSPLPGMLVSPLTIWQNST